ncbi:Hypothetical predicted protein [Mytilus galloprovincialis]|uniref:Tyr recombinase domain-containing protein n=1 Tax=Mytilus galloprovincialis TaxID=29158 RepID=A0A8B6BN56_MYTGA|nr:Hypothetical predicted protein [Mytilus galloprovincialis]
MGKNKLGGMMARISKTAGLLKRYTNHCIKATVATGLKKAGVDLLSIMNVTGHRNIKSLDSYIEGPTDQDRRQLSANLQDLGRVYKSETSNKQLTPVNVFDSADDGSHTVALQSSQISNI